MAVTVGRTLGIALPGSAPEAALHDELFAALPDGLQALVEGLRSRCSTTPAATPWTAAAPPTS